MGKITGTNRRRHGTVLVYVSAALVALTGIASLAVDMGHARVVRNQLQHAADASARYAAAGLESGGVTTAQSNAVAAAADNTADGTPVVIDSNNDVEFGTWDSSSRTFTVLTGAARSNANAVRVTCRRTTARGNPISLMFAQVVGLASCDAHASCVALVHTQGGTGIIGLGSVNMSGNTAVDSYNSSVAPYSAATAGSNAAVESNGNISLSGAAIVNGDASPGVGKTATGGIVTGSRAPLTTALNYSPASAGVYATVNDNSSISQYLSGQDFNVSGGKPATIPPGNYYVRDFVMSGGGALTVTGDATIYVTGKVDLSGGDTTPSNIPSSLKMNVIGSGTVVLSGGTAFRLEMYAPLSSVTISGGSDLFGSIVGNTLTVTASKIHYDMAGSGGSTVIATVQ